MTNGVSIGHVTDDVKWPRNVLWGCTVGYPSDSLASCRTTQRNSDRISNRFRSNWTTTVAIQQDAGLPAPADTAAAAVLTIQKLYWRRGVHGTIINNWNDKCWKLLAAATVRDSSSDRLLIVSSQTQTQTAGQGQRRIHLGRQTRRHTHGLVGP